MSPFTGESQAFTDIIFQKEAKITTVFLEEPFPESLDDIGF